MLNHPSDHNGPILDIVYRILTIFLTLFQLILDHLITESDKTVRAVHSCKSGYFFFLNKIVFYDFSLESFQSLQCMPVKSTAHCKPSKQSHRLPTLASLWVSTILCVICCWVIAYILNSKRNAKIVTLKLIKYKIC